LGRFKAWQCRGSWLYAIPFPNIGTHLNKTTINRSLTSIHVNVTLEPNGLSPDDGKRSDGMALVAWIKGQPLVWDFTVVDTLAVS
jgi:hypothetical protein